MAHSIALFVQIPWFVQVLMRLSLILAHSQPSFIHNLVIRSPLWCPFILYDSLFQLVSFGFRDSLSSYFVRSIGTVRSLFLFVQQLGLTLLPGFLP